MANPTPQEAIAIVFDVWQALKALQLTMTTDDAKEWLGFLVDPLGDAYCALNNAVAAGDLDEEGRPHRRLGHQRPKGRE